MIDKYDWWWFWNIYDIVLCNYWYLIDGWCGNRMLKKLIWNDLIICLGFIKSKWEKYF